MADGGLRNALAVIGSIGSRLRLVLHQPDGGPVPADTVVPSSLPEIEFVAYAADGRLSGSIRLDASRLTDMLNGHDEFQLEHVLAERLPSGGTMVIPELLVRRDELVLVHASGPRGDRSRRIRTKAQAITVRSGPYLIFGDVHATPGLDPLLSFRRRLPMVPLTDAVIEYPGANGPVREFADVVIVNRDLMDWVRRIEADASPAMTSGGLGRPTH